MKDLPADQRPREKLPVPGAASLIDAELLTLPLPIGDRGHGVLALAELVLRRAGGFAGVLHATALALVQVKGLVPAMRAERLALIEMTRRALAEQMSERPVSDSPGRVKDLLSLQLRVHEHEVFAVMFLDGQHRLPGVEEMFRGTLTQTRVCPREVVKRAPALNAGAIVLAHNHPSGLAEPSRADEILTQTLKSALQLVDMRVLDHVVVGQGQAVSMAERGLL